MSWLHKWDLSTSDSTGTLLQTLHCQGNYDCGFYPAFRGVLSVLYNSEHNIGGGLIGRYVGTFHECDNNVGGCNLESNVELQDGQPHQAFRDVGRYAVFNLFVNYSVKSRAGQTTITVGVNNIADTPPFIFTAFANSSDPFGHRPRPLPLLHPAEPGVLVCSNLQDEFVHGRHAGARGVSGYEEPCGALRSRSRWRR